jgi:hypothetical protein
MLKYSLFGTALTLFCVAGLVHAEEETRLSIEPQKPASIDEKATHVDSGKIAVEGINAFALNRQGQILAACGEGPGEVRILAADGSQVRSWKVDIRPESISATPAGEVLVAGDGKLLRFSSEGKLLHSAESPHAQAMRDGAEQMRKAAIAQLTQGPINYEANVNAYKAIIKQLEAKKEQGTISDQEERMLAQLPRSLEIMEKRLAQQQQKQQGDGPSEAQIQTAVTSMMRGKLRIASISTDGEHTYIATPAAVGYGYEVWRMANDFSDGKQIATGLRGCCGQMDVQCCESGIYVAENARHRVVCLAADGDERVAWGKPDRTGIDGFTSCCNPMNVCFNDKGDVFTAESTTGRIKQFNKDGEFLAYIGDVNLVPGCKNVSIAVSPGTDRVYMLDITRGHIVVMTKKSAEAAEVKSTPDA